MKTKRATVLLLFLLSLSIVKVQGQGTAVEKLAVPGLIQPVEILRDGWATSTTNAKMNQISFSPRVTTWRVIVCSNWNSGDVRRLGPCPRCWEKKRSNATSGRVCFCFAAISNKN